jgi:hypothetical protein
MDVKPDNVASCKADLMDEVLTLESFHDLDSELEVKKETRGMIGQEFFFHLLASYSEHLIINKASEWSHWKSKF